MIVLNSKLGMHAVIPFVALLKLPLNVHFLLLIAHWHSCTVDIISAFYKIQ